MTPRAYQLVIIGLLSALVTQIALLYVPADRLYDVPRPAGVVYAQVISVQVSSTPTPNPQSSPTAALLPTLTPTPAVENLPTPTSTEAAQPESTPTPAVDLLAQCRCIDVLSEYERTRALSELTWQPDYQGAVVIPSCNLIAGNEPKAVVLHYTGGSLSGATNRFQSPNEASAHYVVERDGTVYQLVPERYGAYHVNCYSKRSFCLETCPICEDEEGRFVEPYVQSIGIEIVNWGPVDENAEFAGPLYEDYQMAFGHRYWEDYTPEQIAAVKALVEDICARWGIPLDAEHVIGHSLINRKTDPGPALNLFWNRYGVPAREAIWPQP